MCLIGVVWRMILHKRADLVEIHQSSLQQALQTHTQPVIHTTAQLFYIKSVCVCVCVYTRTQGKSLRDESAQFLQVKGKDYITKHTRSSNMHTRLIHVIEFKFV